MTIPSWAKPGARVVCVKSLPSKHPMGWNLAEGDIYTIAETHVHPATDMAHIAVEQYRNANEHGPFWPLLMFRPLITRTQEQDVAQFKHILTPSPADLELLAADLARDAANGGHV